ncbi:MAG TPA: glycoside hydrolase family 3 C-terminal domain-containing protein [Streptosporangiales bacterium]
MGPGDDPDVPPATALPAAIGLASSFDPGLAEQYGAVMGQEVTHRGESLLEAPGVNIARVPQNGRNFEYLGEDPYLAGTMVAPEIRGIQDQGVIAEVKHYDANNQETNRNGINEIIDQRTLREIYLPFEDAVKDGDVGAAMCSYNRVNGPFACEDSFLLSDVLRGDWGFKGFVQSDFGATHSTVPSVRAGIDLEMPNANYYADALKQAVTDGQVSVEQIDTMLVRRFTQMFARGLFDHPRTITPIPAQQDGAVARKIGEQSAVLLKNDHAQLPLDANAVHSIAVIGPYAGAAHTGGGGSSQVNPLYTVKPVDGIRSHVGSGVSVTYDSGSVIDRAAEAARNADVAVVMVGERSSEGRDRPNLSLPGDQDALVEAVAAANPHTVVVVKSGGAVLMPWLDKVPAVLEAWYPGEEDGNIVADLLFGDANPSGKLSVTFPKKEGDFPANTPEQFPGVNGTARYSEGLEVGYRWNTAEHVEPMFPFGFGLSYTTFAFSHLTATPVLAPGPGGRVQVGVDVTNTGDRAGAEVAQVYLSFPSAAGEPPIQLKGFRKVSLQAGQTRHLTFTLDQRAFSIWHAEGGGWTTVDGTYNIRVGDSSEHLPLSAPVRVDRTAGVQYVTAGAPPLLRPGRTAEVTTTFTNDGDFAARDVRLGLSGPAGWHVTPVASGDTSVAPHATTTARWRVTAPGDAAPGGAKLTARADYASLGGARSVTGQATVAVPYASLGAAFDNTGITDDAAPSAGAFASSGKTFSAQALAGAGIVPGGTVRYDGLSFTWPDVPAGRPDNVEANGQVVALSGTGGKLGLLGAGTNGTQGGTGTVYYADGSTQSFTVSLPDWWDAAGDGHVVTTVPYQNAPTGRYDHAASLHYASVPLRAGSPVVAIALPATGSSPGPGMHVFAAAIG